MIYLEFQGAQCVDDFGLSCSMRYCCIRISDETLDDVRALCQESVLSYFMEVVSYYGLPLHVRCDRGGENVRVAKYMWSQPGRDSTAVIMGRSVHNQRIERLWRDVFQGCIGLYYQLAVPPS